MKLRADGTARCNDCSADPAPGITRCLEHLEQHRVASARRRDELLAADRCVVCGEPAEDGRTMCAPHLRYYRRRAAKKVRLASRFA